ncbi:MAG: outer membrane porin, OprD family [Saprospiraceae bacterium]|nr:outer membrane porin, OprD family [Saprospiraceae bacterium]
MRYHFFIVIALLFSTALAAQNGKDSTRTILDAFQQGRFQGNFRSYFMATDNARDLSDYYALAAGGGLYYESAPFHGFNMGIGGAFNFNLTSSDLGAKDPVTGASNRYEIGLFDVEDAYNTNDLDRLEALWLRYAWKHSSITLGSQNLTTPFINPQDGRMRPTAETGVWATFGDIPDTKIEGGWIWKISPRSTVAWYSIGESIGLYPKGLNPDGTASGYPEHVKSDGVALLGVTRKVGKNLKLQLWDQYVENVFNTAMVQADYNHPLKNGDQLIFGLQYTHQDAVADGGNPDPEMAYYPQGAQSNVISAQTGWQRGAWQALAAYTRVTSDGRFLSPREWGREPFYTFMARERIEGSGDVHAATLRGIWTAPSKKWRIESGYGHYYLPDIKEVALNKYAFPAYKQFNTDVRYNFGGALKGLRAQLVFVWKGRIGDVYGNDKYVINKVEMAHYNVILNYTF